MTEKLIEIDIEVTENNAQETPFAGLIPLIQMCNAMKLPEFINQRVIFTALQFVDFYYPPSI